MSIHNRHCQSPALVYFYRQFRHGRPKRTKVRKLMHAYEKIRAEMLHRITRQIWPAGGNLPHEEQLAAEFGVARGTIRRAMADLVQQGIIVRRRKAGSKVASRIAHSSTLTIPIVRHEIIDSGADYGYELLSAEKGGNALDKTGHFKGAPLFHICCLHLSDGRPYQFEDRLINLDAVPDAAETNFDNKSPNEWLVEKVPYSAVGTVLRAEAADSTQARHLKIRKGYPLFVIERQTHLDILPVTLVKMSHPADLFSITTQTGVFD
ncbi:GntR family transcriptional regulator [Qipengyuania marisflavi]|uniref:UTRA domain-containing protein n=1 Tax=Qipengyuania marisflavi TaxID=2486356 RepID=A0A5S3Q1R9_9SPHN|nr:GntR family transcriptional regulator [Qipengyuania marisflavi]TMM50317.1 UTRA domain-containing protein [Qipengyuania marisflavi]